MCECTVGVDVGDGTIIVLESIVHSLCWNGCPFLYHEYPQEHDPMQPNHPLYCGRSPGIGRKVCFPGSWLGLGKECIRCNCMGSVVVGTVLPTTRQAAVVVVMVVVVVLMVVVVVVVVMVVVVVVVPC